MEALGLLPDDQPYLGNAFASCAQAFALLQQQVFATVAEEDAHGAPAPTLQHPDHQASGPSAGFAMNNA